jgi:chromosome partitioning protein
LSRSGNQKGGVGKTSTAANLEVVLARRGRRVLVVDAHPSSRSTRQIGVEERSLGVNLVDVLAGRAAAADAIVRDAYGVDVIAAAPALAGIEMSLAASSVASDACATRSNRFAWRAPAP